MGAKIKIAGKPSSKHPKIKNTRIVTTMKAAIPPGRVVKKSDKLCTTPLCVMAQAMAEAVPKISKIAPLKAAVSTSIAYTLRQPRPPYNTWPIIMA